MLNEDVLKQFKCNGCGECCRWTGAVVLLPEDIAVLAAALKMTEEEFVRDRTRLAPNRRQLALLDQKDGSCEFLEGNRCRVYTARPEQCRTFPYAWSVSEGCPELDRLIEDNKEDK